MFDTILTGNLIAFFSFSVLVVFVSKTISSSQVINLCSIASVSTVPMAPAPINPTFLVIVILNIGV